MANSNFDVFKIKKRLEIFISEPFQQDRNFRVAVCERDYFLFALYYFPHMFKHKVPDFHYLWYEILTFGRYKQFDFPYIEEAMLLGFRGSAKTSFGKIKAVHDVVYIIHSLIGYLSAEKSTAETAIFDVRAWLESNERLIADFGEQFSSKLSNSAEKNTQSYFITKHGVSVQAFSCLQSVRGKNRDFERPSLWIIDDIENNKTKDSYLQTKKIKSMLSELLTGLDVAPEILYICNYISDFGVVHDIRQRIQKSELGMLSEVPLIQRKTITWPDRYCYSNFEANLWRKKGQDKISIESIKSKIETGNVDATFNQEYLNRPDTKADKLFDIDLIDQRLDHIESMPAAGLHDVVWFVKPETVEDTDFISIGVDISEGIGKDSSVIQIVNLTTGEQIGEYESNTIDPHDLGLLCVKIAEMFKRPILAPERNNMGLVTVKAIELSGFPYIYTEMVEDAITSKRKTKHGFATTSLTKPLILSNFKRDWREGRIKIHSKPLLEEMRHMNKIDIKYRQTEGTSRHYDRVMAFAIAWHMLKEMHLLR